MWNAFTPFGYSKVAGPGLKHLESLNGLTQLDLWGTGIGDDALVHLGGLAQLERLGLGDTKVSDAGLVHLARLSGLKSLSLDNTLVTPDGRHAISRRRIYDTQTFNEVGGLPGDSALLAADPDNQAIYQYSDSIAGLERVPL